MYDGDARRVSLHRRLDNTIEALDAIRRRKEAMAPPVQALLTRAYDLINFSRDALDVPQTPMERIDPKSGLVAHTC